jgi:hypothetical protein
MEGKTPKATSLSDGYIKRKKMTTFRDNVEPKAPQNIKQRLGSARLIKPQTIIVLAIRKKVGGE